MPNLILQEFKCIEDIETRGDSPYFVIFIGRTGNMPTSNVELIRYEGWDDEIYTGASRKPNLIVATNVDTNTLVLVAAMEEDGSADIAGGDLANVRSWMTTIFKAFAVPTASADGIGSAIMKEFRRALKANLFDDELVDLQRLIINTTSGPLAPIRFWGEGGEYWTQFRMAEPVASVPIPPKCQKVADELKALKAEKRALQDELPDLPTDMRNKKILEIRQIETQIIQTKNKLNTCIASNT